MNYSQMVNYLRQKNKGKILFIQSGIFYIAVAEDAVFLSDTLFLKTTCHEKNICKVGVPLSSIDKYTAKLDEMGYAYVVYSFNKEKSELKLEKEKNGKAHDETNVKKKCYICLAEEIDISTRYIGEVEQERVQPSYEVLIRYCNTFNIGMDDIFSKYLNKTSKKNVTYTIAGYDKLKEKDKKTIEHLIIFFNRENI